METPGLLQASTFLSHVLSLCMIQRGCSSRVSMLICRGIQSQASKYCHQTQTMRYLLSSDALVRRIRRTYNSKVVAVGACGDLLVGSSDQDLELLSLVKRGWWTAGRSSQLVPQNNNRSAQDSPPTNRSLAAFIFYRGICTTVPWKAFSTVWNRAAS